MGTRSPRPVVLGKVTLLSFPVSAAGVMVECVMQAMQTALYGDRPEIEYLDGVAHPKVSPKYSHALVQSAMIRILSECGAGRGHVLPELRVGLRAAKKTEFVPDVSFISKERRATLTGEEREKPPFAPEIAVEVRSPSDDLAYLARKIERYLATGSVLVLDVDPKTRTIRAHSHDGMREFREGERFVSAAVPWFEFNVSAVFEELD